MSETTTAERRNKWGALAGWCPCGETLSLDELDFNDGLCDRCADGDDDRDDDDGDDLSIDGWE